MSLEELITSLTRETETEREKILRSAEEEARRIMERANEEIELSSRGPRGESERRLVLERARRLHAARARAAGIIRQAKGEILKEVERRALELTEQLAAGPEWPGVLAGLATEASAGLPGGLFMVRSRDLEPMRRLAASLGGKFKAKADDSVPPGVRLVSEDGLVEVDNTMPVRLRRYLDLRQAEVAALAFPADGHA